MSQATFQTGQIDVKHYLDRNERGDAELFAKRFEDQVLFDHTENAWYLWRGGIWEKDRIGEVFNKLDMIASEYLIFAADAAKKGDKDLAEQLSKRANSLLTNKRMKSVLDIASRLSELSFTGDKWDADSMVLPVANGVINLKDGTHYISKPKDYIRAYCPTDWIDLQHPAPIWEKTLQEIFGNDIDLISFVSRAFGYGITGETKEQKLLILEGAGSNGKSIIVDTVMEVLGQSFSFSVPSEVLMEMRPGDSNGAKPFVVALRNKRMVFASESKENQKLNTSLVKQLTGDGYITARTLHEKPITFAQTHKIILITNHLPAIPDAEDYAIWRRVVRVSFNTRFVENPLLPHERKLDIDLIKKLRSEHSGILAWVVRGCLEWQKQGLNPPDVVTKSTNDYRTGADLALQFCTECIQKTPGKFVTASALYLRFVEWCESSGDVAITGKAFSIKVTSIFGKAVSKRFSGKVQKVYDGIEMI